MSAHQSDRLQLNRAEHIKQTDFPPSMVFRQLYGYICQDAIRKISHHGDVEHKFLSDVESEFEKQFSEAMSRGGSVASYYTEKLIQINCRIPILRSREFCPCLMRLPERDLSCGHSLCEVCLQVFAKPCIRRRYHFDLQRCPICTELQEESTFRITPPTAGIRILTMDGGGVRGLIQLMVLSRVESTFSRLRRPLTDCFDLILGSSAGA